MNERKHGGLAIDSISWIEGRSWKASGGPEQLHRPSSVLDAIMITMVQTWHFAGHHETISQEWEGL